MLNNLIFIFILFVFNTGFSQDGKLLHEEVYSLSDSMIAARVKYYPNLIDNCKKVISKRIVYESDSIPIQGYLIEPKEKGTYPCIIFNRGGHDKYGNLSDIFSARLIEYASMGFVVLATQFRGGCETCEGHDEIGGIENNDLMNLFSLIDQMNNVDTSRIIMIGASRGGINTCQAIARTDRIKLGVLLYSPTNLFYNIDKRPEMETYVLANWVPDYWEHRDSLLTNRSPVFWPEKFSKKTNVVIMHGTADENSFHEEAVELEKKLKAESVNVIIESFEGGNHGLTSHWEEHWDICKYYLNLIKERKEVVPYRKE